MTSDRQITLAHPGCVSPAEPATRNMPPAFALSACFDVPGKCFRFLNRDIGIGHKPDQIICCISPDQTFTRPVIGKSDLVNHPAFDLERAHAPSNQDSCLDLTS